MSIYWRQRVETYRGYGTWALCLPKRLLYREDGVADLAPFETSGLRSETPFSNMQKGFNALNETTTFYPDLFSPDRSARPDFKKFWERRTSLQTETSKLPSLPRD